MGQFLRAWRFSTEVDSARRCRTEGSWIAGAASLARFAASPASQAAELDLPALRADPHRRADLAPTLDAPLLFVHGALPRRFRSPAVGKFEERLVHWTVSSREQSVFSEMLVGPPGLPRQAPWLQVARLGAGRPPPGPVRPDWAMTPAVRPGALCQVVWCYRLIGAGRWICCWQACPPKMRRAHPSRYRAMHPLAPGR